MSLLFWLPFGTGSVYSIRKETKNPLTWGLPVSTLATTSVMQTFRAYSKLEELSVKHVKQMPAAFVAAAVWQGSAFCLGHLFTKMAYPIIRDD